MRKAQVGRTSKLHSIPWLFLPSPLSPSLPHPPPPHALRTQAKSQQIASLPALLLTIPGPLPVVYKMALGIRSRAATALALSILPTPLYPHPNYSPASGLEASSLYRDGC